MKKFSIDDQKPTTLSKILKENDDLEPEVIKVIENLKPGEFTYIGITKVKCLG